MVNNKSIRLLIVQYAGDYREAYQKLSQGEPETYYAQSYSVEGVANLTQMVDQVGVFCCMTQEPYDEMLDNGVQAIGAGWSDKIYQKQLIDMLNQFRPTHLVVRTPLPAILRWAIQNQVRVLVTLADSFSNKTPKALLKNYLLANLFNNQCVDWVGNHGMNASQSLRQIGVNPNKIIPWDWPAIVTPDAFAPKTQVKASGKLDLLFVGAVTETKGIGDVLKAVQLLKQQGLSVSLKIAGKGEVDSFKHQAQQLEIAECTEFLGLVPHRQVVDLMRAADAVLVPSRHEYPEGFPMTIYEALCSRTPIVASDHPMFRDKLQHEVSAMVFPSGNVAALANCIARLHSDSDLYHKLSSTSASTWQGLQIPVKWVEVIERWLLDLPENRRWLFENRLASNRYTNGAGLSQSLAVAE